MKSAESTKTTGTAFDRTLATSNGTVRRTIIRARGIVAVPDATSGCPLTGPTRLMPVRRKTIIVLVVVEQKVRSLAHPLPVEIGIGGGGGIRITRVES